MEKQPPSAPAMRQRLDKWLFFARLIKSRSLAQKAIEAGHVAVNGKRETQSSAQIKAGDMLEVSLERRDLVVRVLLPGSRRGPYEEARLLYEDLTPAVPAGRPTLFEQATRDRGAGRPTKRDRRETDRLRPGRTACGRGTWKTTDFQTLDPAPYTVGGGLQPISARPSRGWKTVPPQGQIAHG